MTKGATSPRRSRSSWFLGFVFGLGLVVAATGGVISAHGPTATSRLAGPPVVGPEVPATALNLGVGLANNSPKLVVDPTQPRFVVLANRLDAPDFSCALQVSGDGGRGWISLNPVPELPAGADKCYAPEVAFGPDGLLYYLFVGLAGPGNEPMGAFLTTSADGAQTFTTPRQVLGPLNFGVRMAIDPSFGENGRIHLAWLTATSDPPLGGLGPPPNPIMAAHSDDGGTTFSEPTQVSDPDRSRVVAPALVVGSDQSVHVGYYDLKDDIRDYQGLEGPTWEGTWSLLLASSLDGGERFGPSVVVDDEVRPHDRVMLVFTMPPPALVSAGGRVCTAWTDARHGDADVLSRCSSDGGRSWETLRRVNDDALANDRIQYLPQLSIGPDGALHAIFYDRRNDPKGVLNHVYYTYSTGGGTFAPNVRLTTHPSNSRIGQEYVHPSAEGQFEFGSRLALLASGSKVLAAWPDTRNATEGTTSQSLFTTEVELPGAARDGEGAPLQLGVVLLAVGMATAAGALATRKHWGKRLLAAATRRKTTSATAATRHSRWKKRLQWAGFAGLVVVVAGLALRPPTVSKPLPPSPPVLIVKMHEYKLDFERKIPSGRVVFRFQNEGRFNHRPILVPLSEDIPPILEQLRGRDRRAFRPFAAVRTLAPGERGTFAVDLIPGQRYAMLDFEQGPDSQIQALKGMAEEFRADGPGGTPPAAEEQPAPSPAQDHGDEHHGDDPPPSPPLTLTPGAG